MNTTFDRATVDDLPAATEQNLFQRWFAREESSVDRAALLQLLRADPQAGERFLEAAAWHGHLAQVAHEFVCLQRCQEAPARRVLRFPRQRRAVVAAVAAAMVLAVFSMRMAGQDEVTTSPPVANLGAPDAPLALDQLPLPMAQPRAGNADMVVLQPRQRGEVRLHYEQRSGRTVTIQVH